MFAKFSENRPLIEDEFFGAKWDVSSGLSPEELRAGLQRMRKENETLPVQIARALEYAFVLDNAQIEINPKTPFSAKYNTGVDYSGFASIDVLWDTIFNPMRDEFFTALDPEETARMKTCSHKIGLGFGWTDYWHTVPDWNNVLNLGIAGLLRRAKDTVARLDADPAATEKQKHFAASVVICFEAMIRLMQRFYDASLRYDIPEFSACIQKLMTEKPTTTYEVMQTAVLFCYFEETGVERARTLGPIDRLYLPAFLHDLQNGMTREDIAELYRYFFMHFTAAKRFAQQPLTLGGGDANGNTYCTELTPFILDVYNEMNIYNPKIHVRYHENLPESILKKVLEMVRSGNNSICLLGDETIFAGYERIGIPRQDAQNYVGLGCYEPIIMGEEEAEIGASWTNIEKPIEFALNAGADMMTGYQFGPKTPLDFETFEDFYQAYITQMDYALEYMIYLIVKQGEYAVAVHPSPIYSATMTACMEKATDIHEYPLKYNNASIKCFGLGTAVDSLMAVKKFVFEQKRVTFPQLRDALLHNWEGYEDLRQDILADTEKYGNNMDRPDELTVRITRHLAERYRGRYLPGRKGVLRVGTDSITECVDRGRMCAASPDGRKNGDPLSKNLCATAGMDREGITAYMQSVLKIDAADFLNVAVLDYMLHPSAVAGEKGMEAFMCLVRTFFRNGGFALQGNIVNGETLRAAQKNPEQYKNLQIRVCGWNEYFVDLSPVKQNQFIKRCEVM